MTKKTTKTIQVLSDLVHKAWYYDDLRDYPKAELVLFKVFKLRGYTEPTAKKCAKSVSDIFKTYHVYQEYHGLESSSHYDKHVSKQWVGIKEKLSIGYNGSFQPVVDNCIKYYKLLNKNNPLEMQPNLQGRYHALSLKAYAYRKYWIFWKLKFNWYAFLYNLSKFGFHRFFKVIKTSKYFADIGLTHSRPSEQDRCLTAVESYWSEVYDLPGVIIVI